jgi:ferredoxin-type protein NapH
VIDFKDLAYDYDEEAEGFAEPPKLEAPPVSTLTRAGQAIAGIGLLFTVLATFNVPWNGSWIGLILSIGLLAAGGALTFWSERKDTTPGIQHDGIAFSSLLSRGGAGWLLGIAMTGFYVLIYWYPKALGFQPAVWQDGAEVSPGVITGGLVAMVDPLAQWLTGGPASQWFLYGVLYTAIILVYGVRMAMKYRHNRYQLLRTASVAFFQLIFAFLLPGFMQSMNEPYYELNGIWPLKYDYLLPSKLSELTSSGTAMATFMLGWGFFVALIATPILTYRFGKRWYCSWVCGCGGLAETVGDPFRQLSDKSTKAWRIERKSIYIVLAMVLLMSAAVWLDHSTGILGGAGGSLKNGYGFLIGAMFSGVAGVGFYPLLGNRFWCRFGCPQAAILGLIQRCFSRFRITTNGGQCISCGNCSTYCEMGIDVRAYAQTGMNIVRASCVGCGVCAAVCPRGVLKLENGPSHGDRFENSDDPLGVFKTGLAEKADLPL